MLDVILDATVGLSVVVVIAIVSFVWQTVTSRSKEITELKRALKEAEEAHDQLFFGESAVGKAYRFRKVQIIKPTNTHEETIQKFLRSDGSWVEGHKLIRTFNCEGKLIEDFVTYIHVDEESGEEEDGWKTEYVYHGDKTEEITYYDLEGKRYRSMKVTFYHADGRIKKVEYYSWRSEEPNREFRYYYDKHERLERIESDFYQEEELVSYEYKNDNEQNPSKEIYTGNDGTVRESDYSYDQN